MWTTVLLLAIAANLEPTRIGLVPLLLSRDRPLLQLLAFLVGNLTISLGFGFLVLFVLHRSPLGSSSADGGKAQIALGAVALVFAALLALRWNSRRRSPVTSGSAAAECADAAQGPADRFTDTIRTFLGRGRSPWFAALVGTGVGLPSVDYLAMLVIITTSQKSTTEQTAALVTFVLLSSLVVMAPLIGYLVAPGPTRQLIDRFAAWTRSRSQIEYAGLLAIVGCLLIALGITNVLR